MNVYRFGVYGAAWGLQYATRLAATVDVQGIYTTTRIQRWLSGKIYRKKCNRRRDRQGFGPRSCPR